MSQPKNPLSLDLTADFLRSCESGDLARVKELAGLLNDVDSADGTGRTGLMAAASRNRNDVLDLLLDLGADPNSTNRNGTTPLMFAKTAAFAYGDCTAMKLLIDAGADRAARDKNGLTALDYTMMRADMIKNFLETY